MIGAQNARTLVKNQCRQNTTSSVFLVRIHVCRTIAPAMFAFLPAQGALEAESTQEAPRSGIRRGGVVLITARTQTCLANVLAQERNSKARREGEQKEKTRTEATATFDANTIDSIVNRMPSARRLVGRHPCRFARATLHLWRRSRARIDFPPTLTNRSLGRHSGAQMPSA
jgi:hypothetical protein